MFDGLSAGGLPVILFFVGTSVGIPALFLIMRYGTRWNIAWQRGRRRACGP